MNVKDIMSGQVITVSRATTLRQLLKKFERFHIFPLVPVVEKDGVLVGVVSFKNLMNVFRPHQWHILKTIPFLEEDNDIFSGDLSSELGELVVMEDIMEKKFLSIKDDMDIEEAYQQMKLNLKEEIAVIDASGKLIGMVGIFDVIRQLFREKGILP